MAKITEFYRCFGCGREHETCSDAKECCAVAQHIWRCECGEEFPSVVKAVEHYDYHEQSASIRKIIPSARFAYITQ